MLEILKWLGLSLGVAVILGVVVGNLWGKHQLKRERGELRPVLSVPQRIACAASLAFGLFCVLFAIFFAPASQDDVDAWAEGMDMLDEGMEWADDQGFDMPMDGDMLDYNPDDWDGEEGGLDGDGLMDDAFDDDAPRADGEYEADDMAEANVAAEEDAVIIGGGSGGGTGGSVAIPRRSTGGGGVVEFRVG